MLLHDLENTLTPSRLRKKAGAALCASAVRGKLMPLSHSLITKEFTAAASLMILSVWAWCKKKKKSPSSLHILVFTRELWECTSQVANCSIVLFFFCIPLQWAKEHVRADAVCVLVASFSSLLKKIPPLWRGKKKEKESVFASFCLLWETVPSAWITRLDVS